MNENIDNGLQIWDYLKSVNMTIFKIASRYYNIQNYLQIREYLKWPPNARIFKITTKYENIQNDYNMKYTCKCKQRQPTEKDCEKIIL